MQSTIIARRTFTGRAITFTDIAKGEVSGYVFIWGDRDHTDSYDTWFDRSQPPDIGTGIHDIYYEHGQDPVVGVGRIGEITTLAYDDVGLRFEGQLFVNHPQFKRFVREGQSGQLFTSSGSMEHLARWDTEGRFIHWPIGDVTLTQYPSESRIPAVSIRKHDNLPAKGLQIPEATREALQGETVAIADNSLSNEPLSNQETPIMEEALQALLAEGATLPDIITALVAEFGADAVAELLNQQMMPEEEVRSEDDELDADTDETDVDEPAAAANAPIQLTEDLMRDMLALLQPAERSKPKPKNNFATRSDVQALTQAIRNLQQAAPPAKERKPVNKKQDVNAPNVITESPKYWSLDSNSMMFGYMALRSDRQMPTEDYIKAMARRVANDYEKQDPVLHQPAVRSIMPAVRANEVMISTASGGGDEWVAIAWSSQMWEKARHNRIWESLSSKGMRTEEVPQGHESIYILGDGSDPTVYTIAQDADLNANTNEPDANIAITRPGTIRRLLTPGELGCAVSFSDVMEEDSLIPLLPQLQANMEITMQEHIEKLMLNADSETAANTNINLIDNTPGTGLSTPYYIASDGFLKYALVTGTTTYKRDGGAVDEDDFRSTIALMPAETQARLDNLAFVCDPYTYNTALGIAALKTDDVRSSGGTITNGRLAQMWGVDLFVSGFMEKANSAGKIPAAGGTLGRLLLTYAPYWVMGWKRRVRVQREERPLSGTTTLVAKMRLGFQYRSAGAAAVSYNLTV